MSMGFLAMTSLWTAKSSSVDFAEPLYEESFPPSIKSESSSGAIRESVPDSALTPVPDRVPEPAPSVPTPESGDPFGE